MQLQEEHECGKKASDLGDNNCHKAVNTILELVAQKRVEANPLHHKAVPMHISLLSLVE